jgi:hypothetical protein
MKNGSTPSLANRSQFFSDYKVFCLIKLEARGQRSRLYVISKNCASPYHAFCIGETGRKPGGKLSG